MSPCRFCVFGSYLNWKTGLVQGVAPTTLLFWETSSLSNVKSQTQDCRSLLNLFLLNATGLSAAFVGFPRSYRHPRTLRCNPTWCGRKTCSNKIKRFFIAANRDLHNSFFFVLVSSSPVWDSLSSWDSQRNKWSWNSWSWTTEEDCWIITCEVSFRQIVCELILGVNVSCRFVFKTCQKTKATNSIESPIESSSVGSRKMSHWGISIFDIHFDYCFSVIRHTK